MISSMQRLSIGPLDTDRLNLRCPRIDDAPVLAEMMTPAIGRWLASWPLPFTQEDMEDRIIKSWQAMAENQAMFLTIETKSDQTIIGWIGVARCAGNTRRGALGYWLGEAYHGSGYGVEAATAAVSAAFQYLDLDAVEAGAQLENHASFSVMRRLGMKPIGQRIVWASARDRAELCLYYEAERPIDLK